MLANLEWYTLVGIYLAGWTLTLFLFKVYSPDLFDDDDVKYTIPAVWPLVWFCVIIGGTIYCAWKAADWLSSLASRPIVDKREKKAFLNKAEREELDRFREQVLAELDTKIEMNA